MLKPHIGMTARSGSKCPKSGVWRALGLSEAVTMSVSRGNKMPLYGNKGVTWKLVIMF